MFKLSLALLLRFIFAGGASAADLSTVALFNPAAFPFFPGSGPVRRPSLMRLEVGIPGQPRP